MYEAMIYMCEPETDLKKTASLHMKSHKKKRQTQNQLYHFCEISGHIPIHKGKKKKCIQIEVGTDEHQIPNKHHTPYMHEILGTKCHACMDGPVDSRRASRD